MTFVGLADEATSMYGRWSRTAEQVAELAVLAGGPTPPARRRPREKGGEEATKDEEPAPKFAAFFIDTYATTNNRPSTVREKRRALRRGMLDLFGHLRLDQIGARQIEAYKARRKQDGVGNKTINEELAILSKILGYAEEIGELRKPPPKIRRLKVSPPPFDFLDFEEAIPLRGP